MKWTVFRLTPEHQGKHKCDGCDEMISTHAVLCWVDKTVEVFGHIECVAKFESDWGGQWGGERGHPRILVCDACGELIEDVYPQDRAILALDLSADEIREAVASCRNWVILHDDDACISGYEAPNLTYERRKLIVVSERWHGRIIVEGCDAEGIWHRA